MGLNAFNCRDLSRKGEVYAVGYFVVPFEEYMALCAMYFAGPDTRVYTNPGYLSPGE